MTLSGFLLSSISPTKTSSSSPPTAFAALSSFFWKNFDEGKVEIALIQKISETLELSDTERNEIFFDETIGKAQAIQFYNLMLQIIKKLPEEERLVFLQTFDEKFKKLKRK